ncbi:hypothetical protein [Zhihengliuella halotolerans]|nr:hypothetical protein [Zhihengliuella halotolerans]
MSHPDQPWQESRRDARAMPAVPNHPETTAARQQPPPPSLSGEQLDAARRLAQRIVAEHGRPR